MKVLIQVQARRFTDLIEGAEIVRWILKTNVNANAWMNGDRLWVQDRVSGETDMAVLGNYIVKAPGEFFFICEADLFEIAIEAANKGE